MSFCFEMPSNDGGKVVCLSRFIAFHIFYQHRQLQDHIFVRVVEKLTSICDVVVMTILFS